MKVIIRVTSLALLAALSLALTACGNSGEGGGPGSDPAKGASPAGTGAAAAPAPAQGGPLPKTGVQECDDAAEKFAACMEKNPDIKKKQEEEVRSKLEALKADAQNPQTKGFVAQTCTMFFDLKMMSCK